MFICEHCHFLAESFFVLASEDEDLLRLSLLDDPDEREKSAFLMFNGLKGVPFLLKEETFANCGDAADGEVLIEDPLGDLPAGVLLALDDGVIITSGPNVSLGLFSTVDLAAPGSAVP